MATYSQHGRPIRIHTPLGPDALLLAGFAGHEGMSELFNIETQLATAPDVDIAFDKVLAQSVTVALELPGGLTRHINGIFHSFEEVGRDEGFRYYEGRLVPRFWLWQYRVQSRVFQQQSVPEILATVLEDLRPNVRFMLTGTYHKRDYCVQYRESDFDFVSRLMEEEGLYYFFEHHADKHVLVVTDSLLGCPELSAGSHVSYHAQQGGSRELTHITQWRRRQEIGSNTFTLRDYHFELPTNDLQAQANVPEQAKVGTHTQQLALPAAGRLEDYDYPGNYARWFDGIDPEGNDQASELQLVFEENQRQARLREEEATARAFTVSGQGNCGQFSPGHQFHLEHHYKADGTYLILRVEHKVEADYHFRSAGESPWQYQSKFTALPVSIPYRAPRQTKRPVLAGTQTAVVVGPEGQEIFVDKYGRVKVLFHWDRQGSNHGNSSCWVRVAQIWAGNDWGAFFWPRIGHEVVVAFEEGNPDRPLIVGSVYNASNMPPVNLPEEQMSAGIKSCVFTKNAAKEFNAVIFFDVPSSPYVHVHSAQTEMRNTAANRVQFVPSGNYRFNGSLVLGG